MMITLSRFVRLTFIRKPKTVPTFANSTLSSRKMFSSERSPLISVTKLSELLANKTPNLLVLDVSLPMPGEERDFYADFKQKHIPGARYLDLDDCVETETDNDNMLPTTDKFTDYIEKIGINKGTTIVVYDINEKKGMFGSPRGWYVFRVFGHQEVYVLDGGFQRWLAEGLSVETGEASPIERSKYTETKYNSELVLSLEDVKRNISEQKFQLLDARSPGRFNGTSPEPRAEVKPGHIPESKCIFWTQLLDDGMFKSPEKLAEVYKAAGADPMAPHAATCGSGISACFIALASSVLGNDNVPVYDGAWMDWFLHAPDELKVGMPKD